MTAQRRFLTIEQVAEELNSKTSLIRTLIHTGQLRGIQVGPRGMWRIGRQDLEDYIADAYRHTAERIASGDLTDDGPEEGAESWTVESVAAGHDGGQRVTAPQERAQ